MKRIIQKIVGAALLLALPLSFTSCEDILGTWDKPVPADIPPAVITLKNALDNGAQVEFSYKIGDTEYTATFLKNGDSYDITSSGAGLEFLRYDSTKGLLVFTYKDAEGNPIFDIYVDIEKKSFFRIDYLQNPEGGPYTFDGKITVKGETFTIPNSCPKSAKIECGDVILYIYYAEGETWNDVATRYTETGQSYPGNANFYAYDTYMGLFALTFNGETYSFRPHCLCYGDFTTPTPTYGGLVLPTDEIGKKGGAAYDSPYIASIAVPIAPVS